LVVHDSSATRALLTELLAREGLRAVPADSSFAAMTMVLEEPADLVILGLGALDEAELELVPALKREEQPPRILLCFPSPRRDLAVRALALGADAYLLEPFYPEEFTGVVRGLMRGAPAPAPRTEPLDELARLSHEVAHAVNNPLQVLTLLLAKEKVTKRELMDGVPEQTARIEAVVRHLREFAAVGEPDVRPQDPRPAADASRLRLPPGGPLPPVPLDAAVFTQALDALADAVAARTGEPPAAEIAVENGAAVVRIAAPAAAFAGEDVAALPGEVFVVGPDRTVRPGLARARRLLASLGGSLAVEAGADEIHLTARSGGLQD